MKVAVALTGSEPDAAVNMRFGRSQWFLISDTDSGESRAVSGDGAGLSGGAGVSTAQSLADSGINAVIAGNFGPSAASVLRAAGIKMYVAGGIKATTAIGELKSGRLTEVSQATTASHSGLRLQ